MITQAEATILCRHDSIKAQRGAMWQCVGCGVQFVPRTRLDASYEDAKALRVRISDMQAEMQRLEFRIIEERQRAVAGSQAVAGLSEPLREWLRLACKGLQNRDMAKALGLTIWGVDERRQRALRALGVENTSQAIVAAAKGGLV